MSDDWTTGRLDDRFADIQRDLSALEQTPQLVAALSVDVRNLRESMHKLSTGLNERDKAIITERAANRRALWALTGTLSVALIAAAATVAAALL